MPKDPPLKKDQDGPPPEIEQWLSTLKLLVGTRSSSKGPSPTVVVELLKGEDAPLLVDLSKLGAKSLESAMKSLESDEESELVVAISVELERREALDESLQGPVEQIRPEVRKIAERVSMVSELLEGLLKSDSPDDKALKQGQQALKEALRLREALVMVGQQLETAMGR